MGKVLSLVTTSKGPVSDDLLASIESFTEVVTKDKARAYAAVAIDENGRVIDTWFSALPHVALIGAMEVLKNDYLNELYGEKTDE